MKPSSGWTGITTVNPAGRYAFIQFFRTHPEQRQPELVHQSVAATEPLMALLDQHLSQRKNMLGNTFSMADIVLGCEVHRWFMLPQPRPAWPHLERWFALLMQRAAVRGVLDLPLS